MGPGDRFDIVVIGEPSFPHEYTIAPDGTVDFPMLHRQVVAGYEAQALSTHIRQLLIENGFLKDPVVIISPKEFTSKRITIAGAVAKPGDVPFSHGLSLLRVITAAGGFTAQANRENVIVTRVLPSGERKTVSFALDAIEEGRASDVPLQAGDTVYVYERAF